MGSAFRSEARLQLALVLLALRMMLEPEVIANWIGKTVVE